ncbi:MAG: nuclear transport factor 2 family protein [Solirubrobacteraceae bacterium]
MHPFRSAIEADDIERALALFAPDAVFNSPVVFHPYHGLAALGVILRAVSRVFDDFQYVREIGGEGDADHALLFTARVGDRELQGCDILHTREDGMIDELTDMVRPRSAMLALAEAMAAELAPAQGEAGFLAPHPGQPEE